MPQQPTAPLGIRFFARLDRFHCECPSCTALIVADLDPRRSRQRDILAQRATRRRHKPGETSRQRVTADSAHPYNPFTAVLTCPSCGRVWQAGLLLWSLPSGTRTPWQAPPDTKPTRRQLAQLRAYAGGRWPWQAKRSGEEINVAVVAECLCPPPDGWAPHCPVHGSDFVLSGQAERYKGE